MIWFMARDPKTRFGLLVGIAIVLLISAIFFGWSPFPVLAVCFLVLVIGLRRRSSSVR